MFARFMQVDRRVTTTTGGVSKYIAGFNDLAYMSPEGVIPVRVVINIPPREIYGLCSETFVLYKAKDVGLVSKQMLMTPSSNIHKLSWMNYVTSQENIGCNQPYANVVYRDLADPICDSI